MHHPKTIFHLAAWCVLLGLAFVMSAAKSNGQTAAPGTAKSGTAATEPQAIAELKKIGGVLMHYDERKPNRPVISVEFTDPSRFKEESLKLLASFPQLSGLGLARTPLTDAGLRHLKPLHALETLILGETKVTDEGLVELVGLKKLRLVDVQKTAVTSAGAAALQKYLPDVKIEIGGQAEGSSTVAQPVPSQGQPQDRPVTLSAAKIKQLRENVQALSLPREGDPPEPEGWSKSRFDPQKLVALFPSLKLREGYVLKAYTFSEEGNGNGVVWAMPADAEFPDPKDCPTLASHLLKAPKPSEALDDPMEAIAGDGTPQAYLAASLLRRELAEFAARWHGMSWGLHFVIDEDPWMAGPPGENEPPLERPTTKAAEWKWLEEAPKNWRPQVKIDKDRVTVTFYTYCGLEKQRLYRHTDTYKPGKLRAKVEEKVIAEDGPGYMP